MPCSRRSSARLYITQNTVVYMSSYSIELSHAHGWPCLCCCTVYMLVPYCVQSIRNKQREKITVYYHIIHHSLLLLLHTVHYDILYIMMHKMMMHKMMMHIEKALYCTQYVHVYRTDTAILKQFYRKLNQISAIWLYESWWIIVNLFEAS